MQAADTPGYERLEGGNEIFTPVVNVRVHRTQVHTRTFTMAIPSPDVYADLDQSKVGRA